MQLRLFCMLVLRGWVPVWVDGGNLASEVDGDGGSFRHASRQHIGANKTMPSGCSTSLVSRPQAFWSGLSYDEAFLAEAQAHRVAIFTISVRSI
jgi:hypothetical protein